MRDRLRPVLAALLAAVVPGLGHLLIRRWGRALVWHLTIVGGTVALFALYGVEPVDPLASPTGFAEAVPPEVSVPVAFLVGLSMIDAFLVGREDAAADARAEAVASAVRRHAATGDAAGEDPAPAGTEELTAVQCPSCGKEADPEIDFCHWCTEPLPWADAE